jgi:hypothetical protein
MNAIKRGENMGISKRDEDALRLLELVACHNVDPVIFVGLCQSFGIKYNPAADAEETLAQLIDAFKRQRKSERKEYLEMVEGYFRKKEQLERKETSSDAI